MTALPCPVVPVSIRLEDEDARRLAVRAPRLALLVEASSPRRDVRRARSRLLLTLLALSCPRKGQPRRPWYVPGAVARLGLEGIRRALAAAWAWAPCDRTIRRHLAALEEVLALVRQPGERIAALRRPGRAPRYPDTLILLDDEREAAFWEGQGADVLRAHPELRTSPEAWERRLGPWRSWARQHQLELFAPAPAPLAFPGLEPAPRDEGERRRAALELARAVRGPALDLLGALDRAGVHVPARAQLAALGRPEPLRRAAAVYALALSRGAEVRDGWAWVRSVLRRASPDEGRRALERLGAGGDSSSGTARTQATDPGPAGTPGRTRDHRPAGDPPPASGGGARGRPGRRSPGRGSRGGGRP